MTDNSLVSNNDIKKITVPLNQADKGFLLSFPPAASGSIPIKDQYRFEFDVVYKLPTTPPADVIFTPHSLNNTEKASYLKTSILDNANIGIQIKSIHKAQTQTLVRLQIKDIYNNLLYIDYILIICVPTRTVVLRGSIIPQYIGTPPRINPDGFGPNGGRVFRLSSETLNLDARTQLNRLMRIKGPGIKDEDDVYVNGFSEINRTDVELFPIGFYMLTDGTGMGTYTFTKDTKCPSAVDLQEIQFTNSYLILNKNNNWSYYYKNKLVAKFIRTQLENDSTLTELANDETAILLNLKNFEALISENSPATIPSVVNIYGFGRVSNDSICLINT